MKTRIIFIIGLLLLSACTNSVAPPPTVIATLTPPPTSTPAPTLTPTPEPPPVSNEDLALLGDHYSIDNNKLIYSSNNEKTLIVLEVTDDRRLNIHTAEGGDMEFAPEAMSVREVNGMDSDKQPIHGILAIDAPGWGPINEFMFNPKSGGWRITIDTQGSRSQSEMANFTLITYDDIVTDSVLYSELLHPVAFPEDTPIPQMSVLGASVIDNTWLLSELPSDDRDVALFTPGTFITRYTQRNNPVGISGKYRMVNPLSNIEIPVLGKQYHLGNGIPDLFLHIGVGGPLDGRFDGTFGNPPSRDLEPIVSAIQGMYCGVGGLGSIYDQSQTVCNIVGYGVEEPRKLLPQNIQDLIGTFDNNEGTRGAQAGQVVSIEGDTNWMYSLQRVILPGRPYPTTTDVTFFR